MIHAAGCVDDKVDAFILEHIFIVVVLLEIRRNGNGIGVLAAFGDGIGYANQFKHFVNIFVRVDQVAVDIASAASLSDDTDSDTFHNHSILCIEIKGL